MATPIFTLEALEAAEGDSLLLHYGSKEKPRLIVIDGGPKDIFKKSLSPRLKAIRTARGGGSLEVRMIMVSHIDGDHITGVIDLANELATAEDAGEELPYDILTLWHNSFDDIVAKVTAEAQLHIANVKTSMLKSADAAAVAADVKQGRTLRILANKLSMNLNSGFDDLVVFNGDKAGSTLDIGEKLSFLVLGPRQAEIDSLEQKWAEDVRKLLDKEKAAKKKSAKKSSARKKTGGAAAASAAEIIALAEATLTPAELEAAAAAFLDQSIPNLSSVVVLAKLGAKTMLLTGDARGDLILQSLRDCKLLAKTGGTVHFDILKMPHHGSDRNMRKDFLEFVTADHYVFSANGKDGNPDPPTFKMLFDARPKGGYTLWITNDVAKTTKFINTNKPKNIDVKIRKDPQRSLKIELGAKLPF
jgi:hypothetical protein